MPKKYRRQLALFLWICWSLAVLTGIALAAGTADDPLLTRSYLEGTILDGIRESVNERASGGVADSDLGKTIGAIADKASQSLSKEALASAVADKLTGSVGKLQAPAVNHMRAVTLQPGDQLNAKPGCVVLISSGRVHTRNAGSASLVNIRKGTELFLQWELTPGAYVLVTERAALGFTPILGSADLMVSGEFEIVHGAPYEPQYTDLADALNKMKLFLGTDTGYELDRVSCRDEGLVMMLRLLGLEQKAQAVTQISYPFTDVRAWASKYISYAYTNKLTNGTSSTQFSSTMLLEPEQYMTFLLRALGYTDSGSNPDFDYRDAINAAVRFGVISKAEADMLRSTPLYRDKMVYISYYGLFAKLKGKNVTLLDDLISRNVVNKTTANAAIAAIKRTRP